MPPTQSTSLSPTDARGYITRMALIVGVGGFAEWLLAFSMSTLVMPVFTTSYGFSAVLVGWAVMIPRLVDAVSDPLIGHLSDRSRSRWGRRRPYIFGGGCVAAVLFVLLWQASPEWGQTMQFAWLVGLSVLLWIAYGCLSISLSALTLEVTDDYHERTRIGAITTLFRILPQLVSGWIYWLALQPVFGGEIAGMRWVSVGVACLIIGTAAIPAFWAKERFAHRVVKHIGLREGIQQALSSPPFLYLMSTRVIVTLASYIFTGMLFYILAYHVCAGDKTFATKLLGYYATLQTVVSIAVLPLTPWLGRTLDKRTLQILGTGCHLAAGVAGWFLLSPEHPWFLLILAAFYAPAGLFMGVFIGSALPDICDLDEASHGARREGLFSSVSAFLTKIEVSLCALIVGYMLAFARFDAGLPMQTAETIERLRWLGIVPYIVLSGGALALAFRYPVTAAQMAAVRGQLEAKRSAS